MPARADRGARRRAQGARRPGRRLPGVGRVLGGPAARCARRGMRAPVLAVGDGALGFWGALREVFPPGQRAALLVPQDRERARRAPEVRASRGEEGARRDLERRGPPPRPRRRGRRSRPPTGRSSRKAVAKITDDLDELLAFYDYPAEHWIHLRTTNPMVILSPQDDQACELLLCVVNSVADVAVHDVRIGEETRGLGVSRCGWPEGATRRSPRASASASRSRLLSVSSSRMRCVATSMRRSREASEARWRSGTARPRGGTRAVAQPRCLGPEVGLAVDP